VRQPKIVDLQNKVRKEAKGKKEKRRRAAELYKGEKDEVSLFFSKSFTRESI